MRTTSAIASIIIAALSSAFATTYYVDGSVTTSGDGLTPQTAVKTIAEGITKATTAGDEVVVAAGTYAISATMEITRAITIRGVTGNPADVTLQGANSAAASPVFKFSHASATVASLRVYQGGSYNSRGGSIWMASGGVLTNCIVQASRITGNSAINSVGIYINGGGRVSGCVVKGCISSLTGAISAVGVRVVNGTLENTLVTGCYRSSYEDSVDTQGVVYLEKGVVRNCTITKNTVSHYPLYVADSANCKVIDTIAWGNTALRDATSNGRPNVRIGANAIVTNLCTTGSFGVDPINANPCFTDAGNGNYSLMPGSPCIGAGVNGGDIGCHLFDAATPALGVKAADYEGVDSLTTTLTLTANGYDLTGATVTWAGLDETGATVTHTFGPGTYSLTANVTLADSTQLSVTLPNAIRVSATGPMYVDGSVTDGAFPFATPATAAKTLDAALAYAGVGTTIYVTNGTYTLTKGYNIYDNVRIIGIGERDKTIVKAAASSRLFFLGHAGALVANIWMQGGSASRTAGGIYIGGNGGTVSNCVIHSCKSGTNSADGGGIRLSSSAARCLRTKIMNCGNASGFGNGAGVYITTGLLADCLVLTNKPGTYSGTTSRGGGIYLASSTANARVINCTVSKNTAYEGGGIYRVADAGYVCNTIAYGNSSSTGDKNIVSAGGSTRPTSTSFSNCCSTVSFGVNPQVAPDAPYELPTYELSAAASALCIDKGCNEVVATTLDYAGNARIFGGAVDIGAYEYSRSEVSPGFTSDKVFAVGDSGSFVFTATIQGADMSECSCAWFLDGVATAAATGAVVTNTLAVGRHSVRLAVSYGGREYEHVESDFVTVYPADFYVDAAATASEWPYATPETAASNLQAAVSESLRKGVTMHVAPGKYRITSTLNITAGQRVVGAGMDETVIYGIPAWNSDLRIMEINGVGAYVEGVCVSNGLAQGGGLFIQGDGGTFSKGKVAGCTGTTNLSGGGARITGSNSKVTQSVIVGNKTFATDTSPDSIGVDNAGGGIEVLSGAILENSLIIGNWARGTGGGVCVSGGTVRNCVIVGNRTTATSRNINTGGGGIAVRSGTAVNCIVRDNFDAAASDPDAASHNVSGAGSAFLNCCLPIAFGTRTVVGDPRFKNAATGDYRIRGSSPCRDKGLYQTWMADAVDFFGNPRARNGHVDIGYFQSPPASTMILVW